MFSKTAQFYDAIYSFKDYRAEAEQLITIVGDAGVGKSRLMQEYNEWILAHPQNLPTFRGQIEQRMNQQPYALVRSMLSTHFNIQDSDSAKIVEQKLVKGIQQFTTLSKKEVQSRAHTIGRLLGLILETKNQQLVPPTESPQIRTRAYGYLRDIFRQIVSDRGVRLLTV